MSALVFGKVDLWINPSSVKWGEERAEWDYTC